MYLYNTTSKFPETMYTCTENYISTMGKRGLLIHTYILVHVHVFSIDHTSIPLTSDYVAVLFMSYSFMYM